MRHYRASWLTAQPAPWDFASVDAGGSDLALTTGASDATAAADAEQTHSKAGHKDSKQQHQQPALKKGYTSSTHAGANGPAVKF